MEDGTEEEVLEWEVVVEVELEEVLEEEEEEEELPSSFKHILWSHEERKDREV